MSRMVQGMAGVGRSQSSSASSAQDSIKIGLLGFEVLDHSRMFQSS